MVSGISSGVSFFSDYSGFSGLSKEESKETKQPQRPEPPPTRAELCSVGSGPGVTLVAAGNFNNTNFQMGVGSPPRNFGRGSTANLTILPPPQGDSGGNSDARGLYNNRHELVGFVAWEPATHSAERSPGQRTSRLVFFNLAGELVLSIENRTEESGNYWRALTDNPQVALTVQDCVGTRVSIHGLPQERSIWDGRHSRLPDREAHFMLEFSPAVVGGPQISITRVFRTTPY